MNNSKIVVHIMWMLVVACLAASSFNKVNAQSKLRTRLKGYYEKLPTNERKISLVLIKGSGRTLGSVQEAEIQLTIVDQGNESNLTSLLTNENGEASLYVEEGFVFPKDSEGFSIINASYAGNDSLRESSTEIKFRELNIELTFEIVDSVKHLTVSTFEIDSTGNKLPVEDIGLNLGVQRLYSTYFLEKIKTDEEGIAEMDFPDDIPGDSLGNIIVIAKVEEDDNYGTITRSKQVNWGTTVDYTVKAHLRSLFGDEAPLWMIISVFIILTGALYNFLRAVRRIVRMRNAGFS